MDILRPNSYPPHAARQTSLHDIYAENDKRKKHNKEPTRRFLMQKKRKEKITTLTLESNKISKQARKGLFWLSCRKQGVSQMHRVESKRTPSGMRSVVAWVPGRGEERGMNRDLRAHPSPRKRSTFPKKLGCKNRDRGQVMVDITVYSGLS